MTYHVRLMCQQQEREPLGVTQGGVFAYEPLVRTEAFSSTRSSTRSGLKNQAPKEHRNEDPRSPSATDEKPRQKIKKFRSQSLAQIQRAKTRKKLEKLGKRMP